MDLHIVCYSGGVSSALVGAMVLKKFGKDRTIWINHQVHAEPPDVERFEKEFAAYHGMDITYVNGDSAQYPGLTPYSVVKKEKAFEVRHGQGSNVLCTNRLKTKPFHDWLELLGPNEKVTIYYGFDNTKKERKRMVTRSSILGAMGFRTDYPFIFWENPLDPSYLEGINILPPRQYAVFKHANCVPCIKGGKLHWLCVYLHDNESFWNWARLEAEEVGHHILKDEYLEDLAPEFDKICKLGIPINEKRHPNTFWAEVRRKLRAQGDDLLLDPDVEMAKPCECVI